MYIKSGDTKLKPNVKRCLYPGKENAANVVQHGGRAVQFARSGLTAPGAAVHAKAQVARLLLQQASFSASVTSPNRGRVLAAV